MATEEPGLDKHEWESEWQALEPLVVDSPAEALPELDALVARMMARRGLPTSLEEAERDPTFDEPELVAEFVEARRIAEAVDRGEDVDPGDVGAAISGYRSLYEFLLEEPRTQSRGWSDRHMT